jgi:hypothetical protein
MKKLSIDLKPYIIISIVGFWFGFGLAFLLDCLGLL